MWSWKFLSAKYLAREKHHSFMTKKSILRCKTFPLVVYVCTDYDTLFFVVYFTFLIQSEIWRYAKKIFLFQKNISSVQFGCSVVSDSLRPHGLQHARPCCPSPTPGAYSNSCLLCRWCHPISSSVIPFSSLLQSFPASGSFPMSQFLASGGQTIGVSASLSVLPINIWDWFPLGLTGLISL